MAGAGAATTGSGAETRVVLELVPVAAVSVVTGVVAKYGYGASGGGSWCCGNGSVSPRFGGSNDRGCDSNSNGCGGEGRCVSRLRKEVELTL